MATRAGVTPAPPGRRAVASAQKPITGFFKKATAAEAAEQAAARMEAIAAAAEEAREAREEAAASGPPPKRPGRPRKLELGLLAALPKPAPMPPPEGGASKPQGDWWHPALIWPILREVALRGSFATAVSELIHRFPAIYGALAATKPLSVITVRKWYERGSYTKLKQNYREALVRQRSAYKPGDSGRRGVLVDHPAVQEQIIKVLQDAWRANAWRTDAWRADACMAQTQGPKLGQFAQRMNTGWAWAAGCWCMVLVHGERHRLLSEDNQVQNCKLLHGVSRVAVVAADPPWRA
jgi:hypothetical protein